MCLEFNVDSKHMTQDTQAALTAAVTALETEITALGQDALAGTLNEVARSKSGTTQWFRCAESKTYYVAKKNLAQVQRQTANHAEMIRLQKLCNQLMSALDGSYR